MSLSPFLFSDGLSFWSKLGRLNFGIVFIICVLVGIGALMLYSAGGMSFDPWSSRHIRRFMFCLLVMLIVAFMDIRFWYRWSYMIFVLSVGMLVSVEFFGTGSGSKRWLSLLGFTLQPSEFIKVSVILALARYFNDITYEQGRNLLYLFPAVVGLFVVAFLIGRQPDLGTALMVVLLGCAIFWSAGVHYGWFLLSGLVVATAVPLLWNYILLDYQKDRLYTFMNPELDPLGRGYQILQSKIALGSGGLTGKGLGEGTQGSLEFLPEKHTDFIFTLLAEEFGFLGTIFVLVLYSCLIGVSLSIVLRSRSEFCRLLVIGITFLTSVFVFINTGMVSGLLPVVGVPLPFISYGGSVMMALSIGYGLVLSCGIHHDRILPASYGRRF